MFEELLEEAMACTDAELDEQLRAGELALRELQARQAARLAAAEHRGVYRVDGHRSMNGYVRASWNTSSAEAARWRTLAAACSEVPELGDALLAGRVGAVQVVGGSLHARVTGGDPVTAEEVLKTFEWFCEREFARDVAERVELHGDRAIEHPLARTDAQRRFDAIVSMVRAAREFGDGAKPADVVVNLVADPVTMNEAVVEAELVVASPDGVETIGLDDTDVDGILGAAAIDPVEWTRRRCETSRGVAIHPRLLLRTALTGYVRRVVIDTQGVVVDWGRRTRFFTGDAREAAKLLVRRCTHPGCAVCPEHAEVDHADEWFRDGGPTDQWSSNVECKPHNRYKTRARWRIRRGTTGRRFHQRPDGTLVLPVGARQPDLTDDEMIRAARARLAALRPTG